MVRPNMWTALLDYLPRGNTLDEKDWQRRHRLLERVLLAHIPGLALFGLLVDKPSLIVLLAVVPLVACLGLGRLLRTRRRLASVAVTAGLVYSSAVLVGMSNGAIEAHFHFFIILGFIALYQDWAPFLFNIAFTALSHSLSPMYQDTLFFSHAEGQANPWLWAVIHGGGVLAACVGMAVFWRVTEESQQEKNALERELAERELAERELGRRQFTSDLLANLARRNQSMLYRQLDIINQLEETEQNPDALAGLFRLDHLATRVRRNAQSLLVLSGEPPPSRVWGRPVPLHDVVRAAIAETEDLERVAFTVDERPAVNGRCVTDLTHLLAELTENAVVFSPPDTVVTIRSRQARLDGGGYVLIVEDWGVGMPVADLAAANALLAHPPEVDLSVSQRLGFPVVARLAARHGIAVSLTATPGSGVTAVVSLPPGLFDPDRIPVAAPPRPASAPVPASMVLDGSVDQSGGTGRARGSLATLARDERLEPAGVTVSAPDSTADDPWSGWWSTPVGAVGPVDAVDPQDVAAADSENRSPAPEGPPPIHDHLDLPSPREQQPVDVDESAGVPLPAARPAVPATGPSMPNPPVGDHLSRPAAAPEVPGQAADGLRRRVPPAHLAPELRQALPTADTDGPVGHTAEAASALSRYQASRRSAQAMVDDGFDEATPPLVNGHGS